jgi:hypothetical protein
MIKSIVYAWRWLTMVSIVAELDGHIVHEWWATDDGDWVLKVLSSYKPEWQVTVKRYNTVIATRGM